MITWTLIIAAVLFVTGVVAVLYALGHAPEGYEDQGGFHVRNMPEPVLVRAGVSSRESDHSWVSLGRTSTHAPHGPLGV